MSATERLRATGYKFTTGTTTSVKSVDFYRRVSNCDRLQDGIFLVLFILHVIILCTISATYGSVALTHLGASTAIVSDSGVLSYFYPVNRIDSLKLIFGALLVSAVSIALSISWVFFLSKFASHFITSLISCILFGTILLSSLLLYSGLIITGVTLIAFALIVLILSLFSRPRIDFAVINLRVACTAILSSPYSFVAAAFVQILQGLFIIVWSIAVYGVATNQDETILKNIRTNISYNINQCVTYKYEGTLQVNDVSLECAASQDCQACFCSGSLLSEQACFKAKLYIYTYIGMVASLIWACGVCSGIVQATTAYIVSSWWCGEESKEKNVTRGFSLILNKFSHTSDASAFTVENEAMSTPSVWQVVATSGLKRSLTTSLGSLCFGTLIVALIKGLRSTIKFMVQSLQSGSNSSSPLSRCSCKGFVVAVLLFSLNVIERAMIYFNRYAFCYVGIQGDSFVKSSKSAMSLFRRKGWMNIMLNDDIIDFVLITSNVVIGTITMLTGYYFTFLVGLSGVNRSVLTALGFLSGYFTSRTTLSVISAAVATVCICFGECPDVFKVFLILFGIPNLNDRSSRLIN